MDTLEKLQLLSEDSRYDLACACGTGKNEHRKRGKEGKWLYPVALPQGGYTVLLKTLLSNACSNDCKYCPLRSGTDVRRCTLSPEDVARLFMEYYERERVFGLFLSSSVIDNADRTMEKINAVAHLLRSRHRFRGYIHLKIIPGASNAAIEESMSLATAVSLNIETPGRKHFSLLSQKKDYDRDILRPIKLMGKLTGRGMKYSRVKCTTQFIVGASDETDTEIVSCLYGLYDKVNFKRVYFSAYQRGLGSPDIPGEKEEAPSEKTFIREHRLYQVDFLVRKYGFKRDDIIVGGDGNLDLEKDPKEVWADTHPEFYPVAINSAPREDLLKVPGIGPEGLRRILQARRDGKISSLSRIGFRGKLLEMIKQYAILE